MQCSPQELKETLLRQLDNEFNVVDMQGVLKVMAVLEKYPITKENLEQTRIGKYVNDMRRKTSNKELARRAKDLVRKWQQLCAGTSQPQLQTAIVCTPTTISSTPSFRASSSENSRSTSVANGVRLPVNKPENGLHAKTVSPVENATSVKSNHAHVHSRPTDKHSPGRSSPSRPVTQSRSVPSFSVSRSALSNASVDVASQLTVKHTKVEQTFIHSEKMSKSTTSSLSKPPNTNGSSSVSYALNEKPADAISKLKVFADRDSRTQTVSGVPNGFPKSSSTQSPSNGIWKSHSAIDISSRKIAVSTLQTPSLSPDSCEMVQPRNVLKIKINRTSGTGSVSSPVAERLSVVTPVSIARRTAKVDVNRTPVIGSVSSPVADTSSLMGSLRKVPKVETTAQLIKKMHDNGELNLVNSETLNRIANNQIKVEAEDSRHSIVPDGAKPRPHKRRRIDATILNEPPCMTDADLLRVKAERVRNFLQMSVDAEPPASLDNDLVNLLPQLPPPFRFNERENGSQPPDKPVAIKFHDMEKNDEQSCATPSAGRQLPELPAIDPGSIDWSSNDYTVPEFRSPPSDSDLERLHYGQWEGVNGQRDYRGDWADWTRAYSVQSYNSELLHILPYVDTLD